MHNIRASDVCSRLSRREAWVCYRKEWSHHQTHRATYWGSYRHWQVGVEDTSARKQIRVGGRWGLFCSTTSFPNNWIFLWLIGLFIFSFLWGSCQRSGENNPCDYRRCQHFSWCRHISSGKSKWKIAYNLFPLITLLSCSLWNSFSLLLLAPRQSRRTPASTPWCSLWIIEKPITSETQGKARWCSACKGRYS